MIKPDDSRTVPLSSPPAASNRYGSDAIAEALRALEIPYIALNPGASYRGVHDSIVNHLGNAMPQIIMCLHEEHAVAIAHGYAKVAGRPLGAFVHSNVGLMHASMAIYNAWCDRVPVLVFGATGPIDAAKRRPWIDWIHTSQNQGSLVRGYTKWDDQPGSAAAAVESIFRAARIATTKPCGPAYVCFDAEVQEAANDTTVVPPAMRYAAPKTSTPRRELLNEVARLAEAAESPVILVGRVGRTTHGWNERIALAEEIGARVITDQQLAASFPTDHPLSAGPPATFMTPYLCDLLRTADLIISLDWVDLGGALRSAFGADVTSTVVSVSVDFVIHRSEHADYMSLPPVDIAVACEPDDFVAALLPALHSPARRKTVAPGSHHEPRDTDRFALGTIATALETIRATRDITILGYPVSWNPNDMHFIDPLDYIGGYGGGGLAGGPGVAVGAALAIRDKGIQRLPIAILGDGDFLMGASAIWSAVHGRIPLLIIVANNRAYYNDVVHQEHVAMTRGRDVGKRFVGQIITEPSVDIANLARSFGASGYGPVETAAALDTALHEAIRIVDDGGTCVLDVIVPGN